MPVVYKRVSALGREPVPKFARLATLCWQYPVGAGPDFPAATSIYNVAALAFFPRRAASGGNSVVTSSPTGVTFWSINDSQGISNVYGQSTVKIPHHSEWFSVAWLRLPTEGLESGGPFYEDIFRIRWGLAL